MVWTGGDELGRGDFMDAAESMGRLAGRALIFVLGS
jgi:hypothetical protein